MSSRVKYRKVESETLRRFKAEALTEQGGCCRYCFAPLTIRTATADHVKAKSKGGTNARKNIIAACADCNFAKASLNVLSFTRQIKQPRPGSSFAIWMAWSRRRVWLATHRACRNIRYAAGLENNTPIGRRAA